MKTTPENIIKLEPNQIFCFGANTAGRHGKGAALLAKQRFGAVQCIGVGLQGQSYAIPTKNERLQTLPLRVIGEYVEAFLKDAAKCPELEFLCTKIGCGLALFEPRDIAPLFGKHPIPSNVSLPLEFWEVINKNK